MARKRKRPAAQDVDDDPDAPARQLREEQGRTVRERSGGHDNVDFYNQAMKSTSAQPQAEARGSKTGAPRSTRASSRLADKQRGAASVETRARRKRSSKAPLPAVVVRISPRHRSSQRTATENEPPSEARPTTSRTRTGRTRAQRTVAQDSGPASSESAASESAPSESAASGSAASEPAPQYRRSRRTVRSAQDMEVDNSSDPEDVEEQSASANEDNDHDDDENNEDALEVSDQAGPDGETDDNHDNTGDTSAEVDSITGNPTNTTYATDRPSEAKGGTWYGQEARITQASSHARKLLLPEKRARYKAVSAIINQYDRFRAYMATLEDLPFGSGSEEYFKLSQLTEAINHLIDEGVRPGPNRTRKWIRQIRQLILPALTRLCHEVLSKIGARQELPKRQLRVICEIGTLALKAHGKFEVVRRERGLGNIPTDSDWQAFWSNSQRSFEAFNNALRHVRPGIASGTNTRGRDIAVDERSRREREMKHVWREAWKDLHLTRLRAERAYQRPWFCESWKLKVMKHTDVEKVAELPKPWVRRFRQELDAAWQREELDANGRPIVRVSLLGQRTTPLPRPRRPQPVLRRVNVRHRPSDDVPGRDANGVSQDASSTDEHDENLPNEVDTSPREDIAAEPTTIHDLLGSQQDRASLEKATNWDAIRNHLHQVEDRDGIEDGVAVRTPEWTTGKDDLLKQAIRDRIGGGGGEGLWKGVVIAATTPRKTDNGGFLDGPLAAHSVAEIVARAIFLRDWAMAWALPRLLQGGELRAREEYAFWADVWDPREAPVVE